MRSDDKPVRADDDGPELAAIAEQVRPVVDAGKGRALGFEVVRALMGIFTAGMCSRWFAQQITPLAASFAHAINIDAGIAVPMYQPTQDSPRPPPMTLLHVSGIADRIASAAWCQARTGSSVPFERWVVHDIATALRRACGCSDEGEEEVEVGAVRVAAEHTANVLLPLLIRDARRLCAAARVDVAPVEAAIARHGGRPS